MTTHALRKSAAGMMTVLAIAGAWLAPAGSAAATNAPAPLFLYCGAGLRPPVAEIAALFQRETGIAIEANYGPSTPLLTQLKLSGRGDVFLPGDDFYVQEARRQGLVEASHPVATFVPVILVAKGNPLGVKTVADLARKDVRLGLADERVAAVGRITPAIFATNGVPFEPVRAKAVLNALTAPELGQAVKLGHVDAAINWQAVAWQYAPDVEIVTIPPERNIVSPVAAAVVAGSRNKEAAMAFIRFMEWPAGQEIFRKHHYDPAPSLAPGQETIALGRGEPAPARDGDVLRESWPCMGTRATLSARDADPREFAACVAAAKRMLKELESALSVFDSGSEISMLNRSAGGAPVRISPRTRAVLEMSVRYGELSGGLFDITVAPLVKAWGFAGGEPPEQPLDPAAVRDLLKVVGYRHLVLSNDTARLDAPGVSVNLGGIAKGYAVDVCCDELRKQCSLKDVMIDLGGNIRCGVAGRPWTVGVRNPFDPGGLVGAIELKPGMAVGTSGNYEQFHIIGGQRYAHIIDPLTGFPVQGMAGVTIVSTNAVDTEGISKPLFILGPERSQKFLADAGGRRALFIPDRQPIRLYMTPEFRECFSPNPQFAESVVVLNPDEGVSTLKRINHGLH